jgi:hypothetical protein
VFDGKPDGWKQFGGGLVYMSRQCVCSSKVFYVTKGNFNQGAGLAT